jgi:WhiB family redox-sensing transcriptional regulator
LTRRGTHLCNHIDVIRWRWKTAHVHPLMLRHRRAPVGRERKSLPGCLSGAETVERTRLVSNLGDTSTREVLIEFGLRSVTYHPPIDEVEQDGSDEDLVDGGAADPGGAGAVAVLTSVQMGMDALTGDEADWHERALCAQTDPEAFFPEKGGSTREAKKICTGCEVRSECLSYALANDERFGIWGGLSERERRRLKRSVG